MSLHTDTKKARRVRGGRRLVLTAASLCAALVLFTFVSPLPVSFVLRLAFSRGMAVAPDDYEAMEAQVAVVKNVSYPSRYQDNLADIYFPKEDRGPLPVVLWVHGGAFVGGDKRDIEIYATALACEGYAVVCMNYRRAPEENYPAPVVQVGEVYRWVKTMAAQYPFDTERFVLAGDSAGAHIAAQFAAVQSNAEYAAGMDMAQAVPLNTFKAVLLFCGPFDAAQIGAESNPVISFFLERAAWAYFGSKAWAEKFAVQANVADHITAEFPPAFISDGNTGSFEDHARGLAETLRQSNVPFDTYFVDPAAAVTYHEYQFVMNTDTGRESFQKIRVFLKKYTAQ